MSIAQFYLFGGGGGGSGKTAKLPFNVNWMRKNCGLCNMLVVIFDISY